MAATSLYNALASGLPDENYFLAQNPFFNAGRSVSSWNLPAPTNNFEAIFGPALQGFLAGTLTGYGKHDARQEAYNVYAPLLSSLNSSRPESAPYGPLTYDDALKVNPYASSTMPEGWNARVGQQQLFQALIKADAENEFAQKKAEQQGALMNSLMGKGLQLAPSENGGGLTIAPIPGYAEALAAQEAAVTQAKNGGVLPGVPAPLKDEATKEIQSIASSKKAENFIHSEFERAKKQSSLEALIPGSSAANEMVGVQTNLRTFLQNYIGREMNTPEQKALMEALPDWNDTNKQIEQKEKGFMGLLKGMTKSTPILDAYGPKIPDSSNQAPPPSGSIPSIGGMFNGEKVLSVTKVR